MCQFIETIRFEDGKFYHLDYHQERVNRTWQKFFPNKRPFDLNTILAALNKPETGLYRCRIIYSSEIHSIEFIEQQRRKIKTLQVVHCNEVDYSYKYLDRELIQELTKLKRGNDDILIVKERLVTDTSIGNILFFNGKNWVTPNTPLLPGTTRARLIEKKIVKEEKIGLTDISKFTGFQVVNALMPFMAEGYNPIRNIHS